MGKYESLLASTLQENTATQQQQRHTLNLIRCRPQNSRSIFFWVWWKTQRKSLSQFTHTFLEWLPAPTRVTIIKSECRPALSSTGLGPCCWPWAGLSITLTSLCDNCSLSFPTIMRKCAPFFWTSRKLQVTRSKFSKILSQSSFTFHKLSNFYRFVGELCHSLVSHHRHVFLMLGKWNISNLPQRQSE